MLNQDTAIDHLFHALAVPVRRSMVERLSLGPASVTELAKPLAISLPAVVQHLEVLETSGLVRSEKKGRVRICRIEPSGLLRTEDWIAKRRSNWEDCLDRLAKHLGEED
jgi:DNA-binding transcriptional ArsR family regulator